MYCLPNLCQANLQEGGLTQIPIDDGSETTVNGCQNYFDIFIDNDFFKNIVVKMRHMAVSPMFPKVEVFRVCCMCN